MDGWIKLHRQIINSSKFADPDILRLWILCLTKAAHKETSILIEKQEVKLKAGQFATGRFSLFDDYNSSLPPRKRVKDTTLWSWLKRLEQWGDLDINSTNKYSVISIVKWCDYQETLTTERQQTDNKLTTEQQQVDTNKNVENVKNDKKVKKEITYSSDFLKFWDEYPNQVGQPAAFNNFKKLLKKETAEYLIECAMNYSNYCIANGTDKRYMKKPNNFLNAADEYYKQYETPALIHIKAVPNKKKVDPEIESRHMEISRNKWINEGKNPNEFVYHAPTGT